MPRKTYIVKDGDTLTNVSREMYGVPSRTEDIIRANPKLQHRRDTTNVDLSGMPLLEANEVLTVIVDYPLALVQNQTLTTVDESKPTLFINGIEQPVPDGTTVSVYYDACCRLITIPRLPWNPNDPIDWDRWGNPTSLPEFELFLGSKRLIGGRFNKIKYSSDASTKHVSLGGKSHTLILEKSNIPFGSYPLKRKGETFTQIAEWICGIWGIKLEGEPAIDEPFNEIEIDNGEKAWSVLMNLGTQRNSVLQVDDTGYVLRVVNPIVTLPVAYLEHGVNGFNIPSIEYNSDTLHDVHQGISERPRRPDDKQAMEIPTLNDGSVQYHDLNNQEEGTSNESLSYLAYKSFRDYLTIPLAIPGMLNEKSETDVHWDVGQTVALKADYAGLRNFSNYMIRKLEYVFSVSNPQIRAEVIPPEAYLGTPITKFPWD